MRAILISSAWNLAKTIRKCGPPRWCLGLYTNSFNRVIRQNHFFRDGTHCDRPPSLVSSALHQAAAYWVSAKAASRRRCQHPSNAPRAVPSGLMTCHTYQKVRGATVSSALLRGGIITAVRRFICGKTRTFNDGNGGRSMPNSVSTPRLHLEHASAGRLRRGVPGRSTINARPEQDAGWLTP